MRHFSFVTAEFSCVVLNDGKWPHILTDKYYVPEVQLNTTNAKICQGINFKTVHQQL